MCFHMDMLCLNNTIVRLYMSQTKSGPVITYLPYYYTSLRSVTALPLALALQETGAMR
jgi:hypothetical protein